HRVDDIGARLLEHQQDHAGLAAHERRDVDVLRAGHRMADIADADRRAIAVRDDDVVVVFRLGQLIVGRYREALLRAVDAALGRIGVGDAEHAATSSKVKPRVCSFAGSTWTRIAGFCSPPMVTCATPEICEIRCAITVSAKSSTTVSSNESEWA